MANTPDIRAVQASVSVVGTNPPTADIRTVTAQVLAVANLPSHDTRVTTLSVAAPVHRNSHIEVQTLSVTAVVRGRIQSPYSLAWTFTLDGHDYYVINLLDETIIYDLAEQKWYVWGAGNEDIWHLRYGLNWVQTAALAFNYATNIICGDDTTGALFTLDPDKPEDDSALNDGRVFPFQRIVYGQTPIRGNVAQPCYGVQLTGSLGDVQDPALTGVTLYTSDDQGHTFVNCGTLNITEGDYGQRIYWTSLGSMQQPGRFFKIEDFGGLHRLDGLDMDDDDPSTPQ